MENLRNMPLETLMGVVEDCPWFGAAQKALCEKMSLMGGRDLARDIYASAALQVASRRKILRVLRPGNAWAGSLRDSSLKTASAVEPVIEKTEPSVADTAAAETPAATIPETPIEKEQPATQPVQTEEAVNKNYRGAGDYFSREQYDQVKKEAQAAASSANPSETASNLNSFNLDRDISLDGFCTEALAEIYAEQGYFERAKEIYAKLILAEPEKNTYFATLIEKLNEKKLKI